MTGGQPAAHMVACGLFVVGGDGVLQIQHDDVGTARLRLGETVRPVPGYEQQRPRGRDALVHPGRLSIVPVAVWRPWTFRTAVCPFAARTTIPWWSNKGATSR